VKPERPKFVVDSVEQAADIARALVIAQRDFRVTYECPEDLDGGSRAVFFSPEFASDLREAVLDAYLDDPKADVLDTAMRWTL
jgi:hypothetical protein